MPQNTVFEIPGKYDLFIGNEWVASTSGRVLENHSPLTGDLLCTVPDANEIDVAIAVKVAKEAWHDWSELGSSKRANLLLRVADQLCAEVERFAWLETADTGKPLRESIANVYGAADRIRYYAGAARTFEGNTLPIGENVLSMDLREPLGVVGILGAWSFPLNMFAGKIAPALATGNTVVYKSSEPTPITAFEFARLLGEILPPGVVNVITGTGETTGASLVAHPDVRKISLTGSSETGPLVMANAAKNTKRLTLELGGKNAQIVYADADLDAAAHGIMLGAFMNQGQTCTSGSRIFVQDSIAEELQEKVISLIPKLKVGDPFDESTTMGTMICRDHMESVLKYIELGKAEGGELLTGGNRLEVSEFPNGLFVQPTLFGGVGDDMTLATNEVFGPVATFHEFDDEYDVIGRVNVLDFGLAAGIWTQDLGRAHRTARAVEAGRVWVNCYNLFSAGAAFGGTKSSGFGREDAYETMLEFTQVKNIIIDYSPARGSFYSE